MLRQRNTKNAETTTSCLRVCLLSTTEQRYAQIEKECLAMMFGWKKFYKIYHDVIKSLWNQIVSLTVDLQEVAPTCTMRLQQSFFSFE